MNNINVSIVIPVFNRSSLVSEAIESVLAQTNPNWELIVVDDGSTDDTWAVLKAYCKKDRRIRVFRRESTLKGASVCRNIGIEKSKGDYLIFLDSDDLLSADCLRFRLDWVKRYPDYDAWIFPTAVFMKRPGDTMYQWNKLHSDEDDLVRFLNFDMPWDISGPIWNMKRISRTKWFYEDAQSLQDWEMHIKMIVNGIQYLKVDEGKTSVHTFYRKENNHLSIGSDFFSVEKMKQRFIVLQKVILLFFEDKALSIEYCEPLSRLLLRLSLKYYKAGLNEEARVFLDLFKKNQPLGWFRKRVILLYVKLSGKRVFLLGYLSEVLAYRFLKLSFLLENPENSFMIYEES